MVKAQCDVLEVRFFFLSYNIVCVHVRYLSKTVPIKFFYSDSTIDILLNSQKSTDIVRIVVVF